MLYAHFIVLLLLFLQPITAEAKGLSCSQTNQKHILILCLTNNKGGIRSHCFSLYTMLKKLGLKPIMVIRSDAYFTCEFAKKIKAQCAIYTPPAGEVEALDRMSNSKHFLHFMEGTCKKYNANFIHANFPWELRGLNELKKTVPVKVIYTIHDDNHSWRKNLDLCDAVTCVSIIVTKALKASCADARIPLFFSAPVFDEKPYRQSRSSESANNFFKKQFNIDLQNRFVCTIVGNFYAKKNQQVAIQAFDLLAKQYKAPVCLLLAGYGKCQKKCRGLIKTLGLEKQVYMLGYVNDVKSLIYHSDIVLSTSTKEAFGISMLEAAAMKKPIITSAGTGTSALIEHMKTGLTFNVESPGELAAAIASYIDNAWLRERLAQKCHKKMMANYTYQHNVKKLLQIYQLLGS